MRQISHRKTPGASLSFARTARFRLLLGFLMVMSLLTVVPSREAHAGDTCSGAIGWNEGVGRDFGSTGWRGATADIEQRPVTACTPSFQGDSFSSAWAMLAEALPGDGYAQIGLMRNDSNPSCHCERFFWEYNRDGTLDTLVRAIWGTPVAEDTIGFRVDLQGDGKIHLFYDKENDAVWETGPPNGGGVSSVTPWQPEDYWPGGQVPLYMEEITYSASTYKGTTGDRTNHSNLKMRQAGGSWVSTDIEGAEGELSQWWARYNAHATKGETDISADNLIYIYN